LEAVKTNSVELVLDAGAKLGESPVWSAGRGVLYWVDIDGRAVHAFSPETGEDRKWDVEGKPTALGKTADASRLLVAVDVAMAWLDLDTGELTSWMTLEETQPNVRLNDGRTDPAGRFWVGGIYDPTSAMQYVSYLHRIEPDGTFETIRDHVGCANGTAFSPDGKTMYWAETLDRVVFAYDYDVATGEQSNERVFLEFGSDLPGKPDGACVDETGCYWVACVGGSAVARITPDGDIDRVVEVPVIRPTMPAFGGSDLATMFITTIGVRDPEKDGPGHHGAVFAYDPGVRGLPEPVFGEPSGI
jgi:sugar lactone lactonase YvrE